MKRPLLGLDPLVPLAKSTGRKGTLIGLPTPPPESEFLGSKLKTLLAAALPQVEVCIE